MIEVPLKQIPCQELNITIDNIRYGLRLRYFSSDNETGITFVQIKIGDGDYSGDIRCMPNTRLIPYDYQCEGGNFYWLCTDAEYPNYEKFGVDHRLVYLTDAEKEELDIEQDYV